MLDNRWLIFALLHLSLEEQLNMRWRICGVQNHRRLGGGMMAGMRKNKKAPREFQQPPRGRGRPRIEGLVKVSMMMPQELKANFTKLAALKRNARIKGVLLRKLWVEALSSWWGDNGKRLLEKYRKKINERRERRRETETE